MAPGKDDKHIQEALQIFFDKQQNYYYLPTSNNR